MKAVSSIILSFILFLASFQNSLILIDYEINRDFYEIHCVNKSKPEMNCHGKCEMKKEAEKTQNQAELVKLSFEFNILPHQNIEIPTPKTVFSEREKASFGNPTEPILSGFRKILPHPPQYLA